MPSSLRASSSNTRINSAPIILRFASGSDTPASLFGEAIRGVHVDEICIHLMAEDLHDLLRLSLAEQTVIDVYADQLLTDSLDEQGGNDGRIDAAGQCQQNLPVADLLAECGDLLADESLCERGRCNACE